MPFDPSTATPFDPSTAQPVGGGFDPSTAQPTEPTVTGAAAIPGLAPTSTPVEPTPEVAARNARIERMRAKPPGPMDKVVGAVEAGLNAVSSMTNFGPNVAANLLTGQHPLEGSYSQNVYQPKTDVGQEYVENVVSPTFNQLGPVLGHGAELHAAAPAVAPAVRAVGDVARVPVAAAGEAAAKGAAKMIGVDPELAKVAQVAGDLKHPIDVRPDQLVRGAKFSKIAGQAAADVPFSFSKTKKNQTNFTRNVISELNPEETADRLTPETFAKAMDRSGSGIGEIMGRTDIPLDTSLRGATESLREDAAKYATDDDKRILGNYINELHAKAGEDGIINGTALRELNSEIGRRARSEVGNDLGARLNDLQGIIEDAVQKNVNPKDGTALKDFRRQYAYGKILEPTVAKTIDGVLPPSQLMGAVNRTALGKHLMAMGKGGPIGDLAKVGQLIKDPGTSLTSERGLVYGLGLTGGAYVEPHVAAATYTGATGYNVLGPKLTRAMVGKRPKGAPPEPPPGPPPEPTTSPGAGGPYGGGGAGGPPSPLGDLTPGWSTTPGGGGGPPRGGHEPGLVRSVDETTPLPQGVPERPGSQIPVHEPRPLGDLTPEWETTPGAGGGAPRGGYEPGLAGEPAPNAGVRRGRPQMPLVPGKPGIPEKIVSGRPAEQFLDEKTQAALNEPGAVEARKQQAQKPQEPPEGGGGGGGGGSSTPPKMPPSGPSVAETQRLLSEEKSPVVRKVLEDHLKALQAEETKKAAAVAREHDALALEKAARSTTDPALQARLLKQADVLRQTEKIPVGKVIEGEPKGKPAPPAKPIPAGTATEITPEYIEADRAWRAEHKLGAEDAQRARDVAEALGHDEKAVHAAVRQFEHQPRAFDREIARITEEGKARANESERAAAGGAGNAPAAEGPGAPVREGEGPAAVRGEQGHEPVPAAGAEAGGKPEPEPAAAVRAADEQPGADRVPEAGRGQGAGAEPAGGQAPAGAEGKPAVERRKTKGSIFDRLAAEGAAQKKRLGDADIERAAASAEAAPPETVPPEAAPVAKGVEIREVPGGFEAYRDGKKVGYLKDNLERGQAEQLGENANVDMVKVDKEEVGKGTGRALYAAFNEKHGGRIMPSGKTEPSAWALWKRNYPEKVDAFVKQEADRIRDGADPKLVAGNITDPEIKSRVLQEAEPPPEPPEPPAPKPFVPKADDLSTKSAADIATDMAELRKTQPRSMAKMYGSNGPSAEQRIAYEKRSREWNSAYRKLSNAHEKALDRDNAAFRAAQQEKANAPEQPSDTGAVQPKAGEEGPEEIYRLGDQPEPFYSHLTRSVEGLKQGKADAGQWMGIMKNLKGVKPEEITWSGVEDWLKLQKGAVTREALSNYLREGGVKVTEVQKGGNKHLNLPPGLAAMSNDYWGGNTPSSPLAWQHEATRFEAEAKQWQRSGNKQQADHYFKLAEEANEMAERLETPSGEKHGAPKYASYQLPGGTNYREVLLTLPEKQKPMGSFEDYLAKYRERFPNATDVSDAEVRDTMWKAGVEVPPPGKIIGTRVPTGYTSPHWGEKNVLAHIRLNDRVDADGKKVLFVEELQSDWAQQGKKRGFSQDVEKIKATIESKMHESTDLKKQAAEIDQAARQRLKDFKEANPEAEQIDEGLYQQRRADNDRIHELITKADALFDEARELRAKVQNPNTVPSAPFVQNTSAWTSLAIKRVAKMAADEGYDRVAFVNGEQSADRYDLSKQVSELHYDRGSGELVARDRDGDVILREHVAATPEAMEEYIGKEPAEKLAKKIARADQRDAEERSMWSTEQDEDTGRWFLRDTNGEAYHDYGGELVSFRSESQAERAIDQHFAENLNDDFKHPKIRGLDLKIGGEGMKAFYDKIIPNVAKDVVKKLGGEGLTNVSISQGGKIDALPVQTNPHVWQVKNGTTKQWLAADGTWVDDPVTAREFRSEAQARDMANRQLAQGEKTAQAGFDITPQMRTNAEGGVPLFKQGEPTPPAQRTFHDSPEALDKTLRAKFGEKLIDGLLEQGVLKYASNLAEQPPGGARGIKAIMRRPAEGQSAATLYWDRITADEAPGILMHELGEHFGVIRLLGPERYNTMLNDLRKMRNDPEIRPTWDRVKKNYVGSNLPSGIESTDDPKFLREVAAHLVETQPHLPFVRRLINEIRAFFYEKFGTTMGNRVDANLIRGLAASALRKTSTGALPSMKTGVPLTGYKPFVAPSRAPTARLMQ